LKTFTNWCHRWLHRRPRRLTYHPAVTIGLALVTYKCHYRNTNHKRFTWS
jgi:hypothetical protein